MNILNGTWDNVGQTDNTLIGVPPRAGLESLLRSPKQMQSCPLKASPSGSVPEEAKNPSLKALSRFFSNHGFKKSMCH